MMAFGACPQCKLDISEERKKQSPVVCNHCGFTGSKILTQFEARGEKDYYSLQQPYGSHARLLHPIDELG